MIDNSSLVLIIGILIGILLSAMLSILIYTYIDLSKKFKQLFVMLGQEVVEWYLDIRKRL